MFTAKRSFPINNPVPVAGGTSLYAITKGMIEQGVLISVLYSVNVTGAGAAVRARSLPIRRISLIGDNNKTLQAWYARDLIAIAQIFEQTPLGALLVPASAAALANYTNLEAHVPLKFEQMRAKDSDRTALPTYAYQNLTLAIEWGNVADLFTDGGTLAGAITFTANGATVTQLDYADVVIPNANVARSIARQMDVSVGRYLELVQGAVANAAAEIDLGTTADIRGLLLASELTSTGEPTNTIVNSVTLKEDRTLDVIAGVPWASLRAENSKHFGLTMPAGYAVIDFADDGDARRQSIYRATQKAKVQQLFNTAAVAGTVRVALLTIEPPIRV